MQSSSEPKTSNETKRSSLAADRKMKQLPFSVILTAKDRFIAKSKFEIGRAKQLGLELHPSVNGPYLFDPRTDRVLASPRSNAYRAALYGGQ